MSDTHPHDAIQEFLDGRLDEAARAEVEAHLASCPACRDEANAIGGARTAARRAYGEAALPPGFEARLRAALDRQSRRRSLLFRAAAVAVPLAAAACLVLAVLWRAGPDLVDTLAKVPQSPEIVTSDAATLESVLATRLPVHLTVYDLGMMGWTLEGGGVETVGGREGGFFVYRNASGTRLVCRMYPGRADDLPTAETLHEHAGILFRIYRRGPTTVVAWPEGAIVCAMASDAPADDVLALAIAKAPKA